MANQEARDYAWKHFELHAAQRMTTFYHFSIIATFATTVAASTLKLDGDFIVVTACMSVILMIVALVFWRLDQRVRGLLEVSKNALKRLERLERKAGSNVPDLFLREVTWTKAQRRRRVCSDIGTYQLTYLQCFGALYLMFGALGYAGLVTSLVRLASAEAPTPVSVSAPALATRPPTFGPSPRLLSAKGDVPRGVER